MGKGMARCRTMAEIMGHRQQSSSSIANRNCGLSEE